MGQKLKYVLSDLHIGTGYISPYNNQPDDFSVTKEFVKFLHTIWRESEQKGQEVELIINGDFFSFLQVPAVDNFDPDVTYTKDLYQDSSQEASVKRINLIADKFPELFNALSNFLHIDAPQRSVTIIKGNHDIILFWPGVKSRLREISGTSGTKASLLRFADEFVSREKIYVEHGHQRAEKMNGYHDSFDPRADNNPNQLHYPAGSRYTIDFLNDTKQKFWFVDNIKPATTLIWYAFHWNFDFACQALSSFIRHTPALVLSNFDVEDSGIISRTHVLLHNLENESSRHELSQRYAADPAFRKDFHKQVQMYLDDATIDNKGESLFQFADVNEEALIMGQSCQQRQHLMLYQAAKKITDAGRARIVLFGHTHYPTSKELNNGCVYINTGSWTEDFSEASHETWQALFNGLLKPGNRPKLLPYARIEYDEQGNPTAELLYFGTSNNIEKNVSPALQPTPKLLQRLLNLLGINNGRCTQKLND